MEKGEQEPHLLTGEPPLETSSPQPLGPPTPQCPRKHEPPKAQSKPTQQHTLPRDGEVSDSALGQERLTPLQSAETSRGQAASCHQALADASTYILQTLYAIACTKKPHENIRHTAMW